MPLEPLLVAFLILFVKPLLGGAMGMRADRFDLLLLALRRRNPWRFAGMVYFILAGAIAISADLLGLHSRGFRYLFPLGMTGLMLVYTTRWSRSSREVGTGTKGV